MESKQKKRIRWDKTKNRKRKKREKERKEKNEERKREKEKEIQKIRKNVKKTCGKEGKWWEVSPTFDEIGNENKKGRRKIKEKEGGRKIR